MYTDTLKYNTLSEISYFLGPTEFYNDTNYMYAEFGWYNTVNNKSLFKENAYYSNPKQSIVADSLLIKNEIHLFKDFNERVKMNCSNST